TAGSCGAVIAAGCVRVAAVTGVTDEIRALCITLGSDIAFAVSNALILRLTRASAAVATFAANRRHMRPIAAHGFSTLTARCACLVGREFVCRPLRVGSPATLAGNLTLFRRVHRRKTAFARIR